MARALEPGGSDYGTSRCHTIIVLGGDTLEYWGIGAIRQFFSRFSLHGENDENIVNGKKLFYIFAIDSLPFSPFFLFSIFTIFAIITKMTKSFSPFCQ